MKFLIVIPHYGPTAHLNRLFPSLGLPSEVPEDLEKSSRTILPFKYGEVFIWNNNVDNVGFTKACNEGIRYAQNEDFDVIWLLNNDTEIVDLADAIKRLEAEFLDNTKTGVVGFKILAMDDTDFIHHAGTGQCVPSGVHKVGRVSLGQHDIRTLERWVTGASMAITSGCALDVGVMDEHMVNYGTDSDYCYRARAGGFDVVYLPIPVIHKIGQSQNPSEAQVRLIKADMLYFQSKWMLGKVFYDLDNEQLVA
jgi:GT2 family glycosyltransferase